MTHKEHIDELETGSHITGELKHTPGNGIAASLYAALTSGLVVSQHPFTGFSAFDPNDFSSMADAIEAANTEILSQSHSVGTIYLPSQRPNGDRVRINRQVQLGSTQELAAVSIAAPTTHRKTDSATDGTIRSTIDDGSVMFVISSDLDGGAARNVTVTGAFSGNNNNTGLVKLQNINDFDVSPTLTDFAGPGIILDGTSNGCIGGNIHPSNDSARIIDSRSGYQSNDSDIVLKPTMETETNYGMLATDTDSASGEGFSRLRVSGHHEGAVGSAVVDVYEGGVIVDPNLHLTGSGTGNSTHGIRVDGGGGSNWIAVSGGSFAQIGGDAIRLEGDMMQIRVSQSTMFNHFNINGDSIYIAQDPSNESVVPDPASLAGTVTYPSGTTNLRYMQTSTLS